MAAGTVYLRTNRFEVKLEGITFKTKDFEYLCKQDFLFPNGKVRVHKPIVGIDVIQHPRDPNIVLVLLCFGLGCVILRFRPGEALPDPILKFLADARICFVGFGIPEKGDLFPFERLGFSKQKSDIGYLASRFFNNPKYRRCDLGDLARKVLGIKRMIGLADSSSFARHEQIKCGICQLFISTIIAISLLSAVEKKKVKATSSPKKGSFLANLASLPLFAEGWRLKLNDGKCLGETDDDGMDKGGDEDDDSCRGGKNEDASCNAFVGDKGEKVYSCRDYAVRARVSEEDLVRGEDNAPKTNDDDDGDDDYNYCSNKESPKKAPLKGIFKCLFPLDVENLNPYTSPSSPDSNNKGTIVTSKKKSSKGDDDAIKCPFSPSNDSNDKEPVCIGKKPLKGILKCPSSKFERCMSSSPKASSPPNAQELLRRANSKGHNVSFKCDD
ncbi:hypothetical protein DM860_002928 [Cuscuta australis]|uniref:3'-5' exonuclease domain-containing protein n=1 Tax=Cuscuta australis TaxID=267555 RepID=A0A328D0W9_9ASTE|nr:hypothetical protein DM860_002928 [Cuscuta australis]